MDEEKIKKEIKNIKRAIDLIAHTLENIRTWGPVGIEDKVHNILYHENEK